MSSPDQPVLTKGQTCIVLAVGLAFGLAVVFRWGHVNGFPQITNHEWVWRNLGNLNVARLLLLPGILIGWVLWRIEKGAGKSRPWGLLALLAISNFLLQTLGMLADFGGIERVRNIVLSPLATSYFQDALNIQNVREWLSHFHETALGLHSSTHPPGPILLYYAFAKLFGPSTGALLGGCAVGLLGSAGVLMLYKFAGLWTSDPKKRLIACAFYALCPALIVFFPEFDQAYPILSMFMMFCWVKALAIGESPTAALALGAATFVATFFAYNLLAVGGFFFYYGLWWLWRQAWTTEARTTLIRSAGIAIGTCCGLYLILSIATGYNPPAAFLRGLTNQASLESQLPRPYAIYALFDLYDFSLGAGMMVLPLLWFYLRSLLGQFKTGRVDIALTLAGLLTILTVDLSGLLRGETARVWLFLQPLVAIPAALALSTIPWPWRFSIIAVQWWILVCMKTKMYFVSP